MATSPDVGNKICFQISAPRAPKCGHGSRRLRTKSEVWGVRRSYRLPPEPGNRFRFVFVSCVRAGEAKLRVREKSASLPLGLRVATFRAPAPLLSGSGFGCKIVTTLAFWAGFRSKKRVLCTAHPLVCTIKHEGSLAPGLFSKSNFFDFGS